MTLTDKRPAKPERRLQAGPRSRSRQYSLIKPSCSANGSEASAEKRESFPNRPKTGI